MDEKLIDQLYSRATSLGYKKSRDEFASLIKTDQDVYDDMFSYAQSSGLVSDATQFGSMVGRFQAPYKKKEEPTMVGLPEQIIQTKPQPKPEQKLRVSETPVPKGEQRLQAVQRAATELPSVDGLSVLQETEQTLKPSVGIVTESTAVPKIDVKAIQDEKAYREKFGDRESYSDYVLNKLNSGAAEFDKVFARLPETVIDIFAIPQNAIAYYTGLDIATNSEKIKEQLGIRNPILDWLNEEQKISREKTSKFEKENYATSSVAENIAKGNYGDAFELLGASIIESLPVSLSMMYGGATLTPTQLVGAGTLGFYGQNADELAAENPDMSEIERNVKALGMASAETVFSAIGTGTIGQVYRDLVKREGAEVAKDVLQSGLAQTYKKAIEKYGMPVGLVGEGIEEAATQITQNVISGKSPFQGAADAFIIGAGSGAAFTAPISGIKAVNYISDKIDTYDTKVKIENLVKEKGTTLDKLFNVPVADDITVDQVEIANMGKSRDLLLKDLEVKMKNGDITEDDAKQSLYVFDKVQQVSNAVKDLDVTAEEKATIATLLKKRDDIKVKMQNKDDVLLGREKQQIADINNQINEIILKPKQDAVQEQAAGEVSVQPTTRVSQQMAEGEPQAEPQGVTAEGIQETVAAPLTQEEVTQNDETLNTWNNIKIGESFNVKDPETELPETETPLSKGEYTLTVIPISSTDLSSESNQNGVPLLSREYWETAQIPYIEDEIESLDRIKEGFDTANREPIVVEKKADGSYEVMDGHHRLTVATELGRNTILALVKNGKITQTQQNEQQEVGKAAPEVSLKTQEAPVVKAQLQATNSESFFDDADEIFPNDHILGGYAVTDKDGKLIGRVKMSEVDDNTVKVDEVVSERRGERTGNGSAIMKMVIDNADKNNVTLTLTPNLIGGLKAKGFETPEKLRNFYEKFGFVKDAGKATMTRVPVQPQAPVVKAQVEMVQFPTATTTLETEGTGIITEGTEPVFKGSNAPTVDLSTDKQERYAEDYTVDEIEAKENDPTSRVVTVASTLSDGKVTYKPKGKPGKKTFSLPFINNEASKKIKDLRAKYKLIEEESIKKANKLRAKLSSVVGKGDAQKQERAKIKAQIKKIKESAEKERLNAKAEINQVSKQVLNDFRNTMVQNLLALYDSLTPEFIAKSKQWYVGANRMAQAMAQKYNISIDQVGGILAVLSPQKDWFNNVSAAERVIQVMSKYADRKITKDIVDKAVAYNTDKKSGKTNKFAESIKKIFNKYGEISINEANQKGLSKDIQSELLRAFDQGLHSPKVPITDPNGKFVGFDTTPIRWNSCSEIASAMSVFRDGSKENITRQLGGGNKVRNFYNNIVDPDSETPYVTADTHALSAALNSPISAEDASGIGLFNGGAEPLYALVKAAYIDAARIAGIKPREMQSITWEAQRIGINDKGRTEDKKNEVFQYITEYRTNNQTPYERASELIARNRSADPSWGRAEGIRTQRTSDEIRESARLRAQQRASEVSALRGQPGAGGGVSTAAVGGAVTGGTGVTETVKAQLGVPFSDARGIAAIESRSQEDARKKGVVEAVKKAVQTFKSLFPDADIYIHETPQSFLNFGSKYGWTGRTRGSFLYTKNADGTYKARIDINLSSANATTVYHEVAHAVMLKAFGENKQLFESFRDKMSSVLKESTVASLNQFADLYSKEQSPEEWLVELAARMSDQEKQIPQSLIDKIAAIVNKIVSDITNGAFKPFSETVTKKEVIDFFNEMSSSIRQGEKINVEGLKIGGPAKTGVSEKVAKQEGKPVSELPGYDKLMRDVTDTLIPNALKRKLTGQEMIDLVKKFVEKSDIYKQADDIQRDELVRQVNGMLGEAYRNPPSVQRLLGMLKDVTKITITEKQALENQIKSLNRGAKNMKAAWVKASGELAKGVKDLVRTGKITIKQASAVLRRFSAVNVLDEQSVSNFIEYMDKVFKNAEYADKIAGIRKSLARAKKNIETKLGISEDLKPMLRQMLAINPNLIPMDVLDSYVDLVNMLSERAAVLNLADISEVTKDTSKIIDAVEEEQFKAEELKEMFDDFQDKELNDEGKVDFAKTINKMIDAGVVNTSDAEIMRKYKSTIMPTEGKVPMTEQEIADEKRQLQDFAQDAQIDTSNLPIRAERDAANRLAELVQTNGLASLNNQQLKNLLRVINNINNGFFPHYAQRMIEKISSANSGTELTPAAQNAKPLSFSKMYSRVKNLVTKDKNAFITMIARNPLYYIDQVFGDFKTKTIYKNLFEPIAKAYAKFSTESNNNSKRLDKALNDVSASFKDSPAKVRLSKYKIMTYLLQLEYNSNPGMKGVAPAIDFINKTIKAIESGETNFNDYDVETLQQIVDDFAVNGQIDMQKLEDSFNDAELKAIKTIQDINKDLSEKASYTANVIRGEKFVPINNYIHHSVISDGRAKDDLSGQTIIEAFSSSRMPSSRAKSLLERTPEAKAINFDPFNVTNFVSRSQLMDYYLTEPIRTGRMAVNVMKSGVKGKQARDIANAIGTSYEQALENVLVSSFGKTTSIDDAINYLSTQGYRAVLAGAPRFLAELLSNVSFVLSRGSKMFAEGYRLKGIVFSANGVSVMNNLNSSQTNRVYSDNTLSGSMIDPNMLKHAAGIKNSKSKGDVANAVNQIYTRFVKKKIQNPIEMTADALISTPDKIVTRPVWFGSFSLEFKKITGTEPDFDKIAANDEAYMNENKEALQSATAKADQDVTFMSATDNPFMGILKGRDLQNQSAPAKAFNRFNNYMTRFVTYEYITARTGINALMGNGDISKKQGAALIAAVTSRMVVYSLLTQTLSNSMLSMFGDDDDEEDDKSFAQKLGQAVASSATSLVIGRDFGNSVRTVMNIGIEEVNKKYLDFLREGDYDPYKDAIQFSIVPPDKEGARPDANKKIIDLVTSTLGPLAPAAKTGALIARKVLEAPKKTKEAQEIREKEIGIRIPLEILGNLGLIPLYKDVRKIALKEIYKDLDKSSKSKKLKDDMEELLLQGYPTRSDMKRYDPSLYEETFGEGGLEEIALPENIIKREIRKQMYEIERQIKDEAYEYTPKKKKKMDFGEEEEAPRRKKSSGFGGSKKFGE